LNNNYLRALPYEIGKLFQLQILGLKGNPLCKDLMDLYEEANGTQKIVALMLDNLHGERCLSIFPALFSNFHTIFRSDSVLFRVRSHARKASIKRLNMISRVNRF